uniref:Secreted protein n=1 Tax=Rhizophora mucronata TaxID=61149 RepID=A0A2P2NTA3_RHIMU
MFSPLALIMLRQTLVCKVTLLLPRSLRFENSLYSMRTSCNGTLITLSDLSTKVNHQLSYNIRNRFQHLWVPSEVRKFHLHFFFLSPPIYVMQKLC